MCPIYTIFGFCYVPPADSHYYSHKSFADMQEKLKTSENCDEYCIIGDVNARFGMFARELPSQVEVPNHDIYSYPVIADDVRLPNDNAFILSSICKESKLLLVNNLKTPWNHFVGGKTYRKGKEWVSALDTCVMSCTLVRRVSAFAVVQDDSLPSDHAPITLQMKLPDVNLENLSTRANSLGAQAVDGEASAQRRGRVKPVKIGDINERMFLNKLQRVEGTLEANDLDEFAKNVTDTLYRCACASRGEQRPRDMSVNVGRWEKLLENKDDLQIWRAIDWRGEYGGKDTSDCSPSDEEFKVFFEQNFNPPDGVALRERDLGHEVYVPILDDPISAWEVQQQVQRLKPDKASGPDGVTPGIFKILPVEWIVLLTTLFNTVLSLGTYPREWARARLVTVFKKGDRKNVKNYRGINVINCIAKVYDMVLCERLKQWFRPHREQAGGQQKRGCLEHIVSLRLLCDMAKRKRLTLFVTFVDFAQAYDRVPRHVLVRVLQRLGCGTVMLCTIIAMYNVTESWIGTALVTISLGVRQGSPTSCLLFIIFVDDLIRIMKEGCGHDGFLTWLHTLVLMDDTVILSTTRPNMLSKLTLLQSYCSEYGMEINQAKTKFFVIHGRGEDPGPLIVNDLVVEQCSKYVYLGSVFTSDGSTSSAVKEHAASRMPHVLKFVSFISKNNDIPFIVKKRVFEAALMSTLVYGCESWIGGDLKPMVKLYNWCLKTLLGVRRSTCNDVCYVESGYPPLGELVRHKQHKFFRTMWRERSGLDDDPLMFIIGLVTNANTVTGRCVRGFLLHDPGKLDGVRHDLIDGIINSNSSRRITYKNLISNDFSIHHVYSNKHTINEMHRMSFTKFRVSGHHLACETGRWNRRGRGRLPLEERVCICGQVQTERHVVQECPCTQYIRDRCGYTSLEQLFSDMYEPAKVCEIIHEILHVYN